ncbi:hypothetical protein E2C01_077591 [Portunus trituberculatus]|uniref:Uncharacterized protein n=1 Tax=Portunus trituberculatus TaxID=210409 RepID=A0A5B7IGF0_PORTR|nr:hypothetical protein [Portunus trituberculatus]
MLAASQTSYRDPRQNRSSVKCFPAVYQPLSILSTFPWSVPRTSFHHHRLRRT